MLTPHTGFEVREHHQNAACFHAFQWLFRARPYPQYGRVVNVFQGSRRAFFPLKRGRPSGNVEGYRLGSAEGPARHRCLDAIMTAHLTREFHKPDGFVPLAADVIPVIITLASDFFHGLIKGDSPRRSRRALRAARRKVHGNTRTRNACVYSGA